MGKQSSCWIFCNSTCYLLKATLEVTKLTDCSDYFTEHQYTLQEGKKNAGQVLTS